MANEINVISLYNTINTLTKLYHAGYDSMDDFNNKLKSCEIALLGLFHEWDEDTQSNTDHLAPFRVHEAIAADANGFVALPENYAFKSAVHGVYLSNPCTGEVGIQVEVVPAYQLRSNEVAMVQSSPLALPSIEEKRLFYTFRNGGIQLFPKELGGIDITYLRYPVYGKLVLIESIVEDEDVLTPSVSESINLQWKDITFEYFKYAMLFLYGVELKETALISASQMEKLASVFKLK